jgi:hypothetical protein
LKSTVDAAGSFDFEFESVDALGPVWTSSAAVVVGPVVVEAAAIGLGRLSLTSDADGMIDGLVRCVDVCEVGM